MASTENETPAAVKVFATTELLEGMVHLPLDDLLVNASRVNKTFRDTINGSPYLSDAFYQYLNEAPQRAILPDSEQEMGLTPVFKRLARKAEAGEPYSIGGASITEVSHQPTFWHSEHTRIAIELNDSHSQINTTAILESSLEESNPSNICRNVLLVLKWRATGPNNTLWQIEIPVLIKPGLSMGQMFRLAQKVVQRMPPIEVGGFNRRRGAMYTRGLEVREEEDDAEVLGRIADEWTWYRYELLEEAGLQ